MDKQRFYRCGRYAIQSKKEIKTMKKLSIDLDYTFDTVLECGYGVYEEAGGTASSVRPNPFCIIRMGTFSSKKGMREIAEECREATTEKELRAIASKLKLTDPRISIVF